MNAYLCPARGASPRRVYWERWLPRVYEKSARPTGSAGRSLRCSPVPASVGVGRPSPQGRRIAARQALIPASTGAGEQRSERPALPRLFTDPGRRSRCIMAFLALLMCLGVWLAPAGRIADAAGPATTPPTTSDFRLPTSDFRLPGSSDDTARVAVRGRSTDRRGRGSYPAGVAGREPTARSGRRSTTDGAWVFARCDTAASAGLHAGRGQPGHHVERRELAGSARQICRRAGVVVHRAAHLTRRHATVTRRGGWPDFRRHGPIQRSARR